MSRSPHRSPLTGDDADNHLDTDAYLRRCTEIDPADLNDEFVKIPGALAYWNNQYAEAHRKAAVAKLDYDRAWAQLYCHLKSEEDGAKRGRTVDQLKAICDNDEEVYQFQLAYVLADAERLKMRGIVDAVVAKKDMLQSLGAKLREEMRGDPSIRNSALVG